MKQKINKFLNTYICIRKGVNPVHDFYTKTSASEKKKIYTKALRAAQEDQLLILNH
jgi:hypothetical protein